MRFLRHRTLGADAAMLQQGAAAFVAQAVAVGVGGIVTQQVVAGVPCMRVGLNRVIGGPNL